MQTICEQPRLLIEESGEAAWNMAVDEALLIQCAANHSGVIVRIFEWADWAVTIGRFQSLSRNFRQDIAEELGVRTVRRITGGRAILHGDDITVTVIASLSSLNCETKAPFSASRIYKILAEPLISAMERVGVDSISGECLAPDPSSPGDCFQTISRADIIDKGTGSKIIGAALHCRENFVMQQASIPLRTRSLAAEQESLRARLFGGETKSSSELESLDRTELTAALVKSYADFFRKPLESSVMTEEELNSASKLLLETYSNPQWTAFRP